MPSALVVGAGGLGCPALLALVPRAAVTIIDDDRVDISNLQRQILHGMADLGALKVSSAAAALRRRHPTAQVETVADRLHASNAPSLIARHDVVLDCSDSVETRFLLNDLCVSQRVPLVHGGVVGWTGQLMAVMPEHTCFRCIFEDPPTEPAPTCQDAGILGALCGVIGGLMAREALAILRGEPSLAGTLMVYDGRADHWRTLRPRRRPTCPAHPAPEVATW